MNLTAVWSWRNEPDLMARLRDAQNSDANINQDIMTIVGFMTSREQLEQHVISAETRTPRKAVR